MRRELMGIACILLIAVSCTKSKENDFVVPRNPETVIKGKNDTYVTVSDVYSRFSEMKRKVEIRDQLNTKIGTAYMIVSSTDKTRNLYDKLKDKDSDFCGRFSIEVEGQVIYTREIKNGTFLKAEKIAYKGKGPVYNPNVACTVSTVHDCVAYIMEDMNWWQLTSCAIRATLCYGLIWGNCTWDVCNQHLEYTNPN